MHQPLPIDRPLSLQSCRFVSFCSMAGGMQNTRCFIITIMYTPWRTLACVWSFIILVSPSLARRQIFGNLRNSRVWTKEKKTEWLWRNIFARRDTEETDSSFHFLLRSVLHNWKYELSAKFNDMSGTNVLYTNNKIFLREFCYCEIKFALDG